MTYTPHGNHLIAGEQIGSDARFESSPATGSAFEFSIGSPELVAQACAAASAAFAGLAATTREQRATLLETIADEIDARGPAITEVGSAETGLPAARLEGERGHTTGQLRLFAQCIREIRHASPDTMVEVLIPDFQGRHDLVRMVVDATPEVIAHNIETVERLTPTVRDPRAGYRQSLEVLAAIKQADPLRWTKSSIMVGLGETEEEVLHAMGDLRAVGTDFLTVGQYLKPSNKHLKVEEFITPEQFERYRELGEGMGFRYIASGPLVRSSYKAGEFFIRQQIESEKKRA